MIFAIRAIFSQFAILSKEQLTREYQRISGAPIRSATRKVGPASGRELTHSAADDRKSRHIVEQGQFCIAGVCAFRFGSCRPHRGFRSGH